MASPREVSRDTRTCLVFAHLNRYTARFIAGECRIARAVVGQVCGGLEPGKAQAEGGVDDVTPRTLPNLH